MHLHNYLHFLFLMIYNYIKSRGEFMYTMYIIFAIIISLAFVTGSIILFVEHKQKNKRIIFDEEII